MTTDFLLTVDVGRGRELWARQIKPESKLTAPQIDKFRIEEQYFREIGIHNWGIVTDKDISKPLAKNIEDLHEYFYINEFWDTSEAIAYQIADELFQAYVESDASLSTVAIQLDQKLGLERGTCLKIAKHMLSRKKWITDMHKPIFYSQRIHISNNNHTDIQGKFA